MVDKTTKFEVPEALHALKNGEEKLSYYCKADLCNVKAPIEAAIKDQAAMEKLLKENPKTEKMEENLGPNGAAQTTVAVATIAFSMVMARLAL